MGGGSRTGRVSYAPSAGIHGNGIGTLGNFFDQERKKVFISHSMRDHAQARLLVHQAGNENFDIEFEDTSLADPVRGRDWHPVVEQKIAYSDKLVVMVGEDTHSRTAVDFEIATAYRYGIPVIPVRIHRDKNHKLPRSVVQYGYEVSDWDTEELHDRINMAS